MDLAQLANLGEFIGGVAVLVTLIYLALQIRQGSRFARIEAHRETGAAMSEFIGDVAKDLDLHDLWYNGLRSNRELGDEEQDRLGMLLYRVFFTLSTAHRYADLDPSLWDTYRGYIDRNLGFPYVQEWWVRQRGFFTEAFRMHVDARIAEFESRTANAEGEEG